MEILKLLVFVYWILKLKQVCKEVAAMKCYQHLFINFQDQNKYVSW